MGADDSQNMPQEVGKPTIVSSADWSASV